MVTLRLKNLVSNKRKSGFRERLYLKDRLLQWDEHIREIDKYFTIKEKQNFLSWGEGGASRIGRGSWTMEGKCSVRMDRKRFHRGGQLPERADKGTFHSHVIAQGWDPRAWEQREISCSSLDNTKQSEKGNHEHLVFVCHSLDLQARIS